MFRVLRQTNQAGRKAVRLAIRTRMLGLSICVFVLVIGPIDLFTNLTDWLYPQSDIPRMHPLTWICTVMAFWATAGQHLLAPARRIELVLWATVLSIVVVRTALAPVFEQVIGADDLGSMGTNTAAGFALLASAQILRSLSQRSWALAMAALACLVPMISINGLMLGQSDFYGEMSLPTAFALLGLGLANLMRFLRVPALYILINDTPTAELVRHQLRLWGGMSVLMPFALRLVSDQLGVGFSLLYTVQMSCILIGVVHFGLRFAKISARSDSLNRSVQLDVDTDQLTGATTRRAALHRFAALIAAEDVGLMVLDIDHFKAVNDTHGHAAGDRVLRAVAGVLRSNMKLSDLLVRWGGEEFVVILPSVDAATLASRAEELRAELEWQTDRFADLPSVTASFGLAWFPRAEVAGLEEAVALADSALYAAKAQGRNRVVSVTDLSESDAA